MAESPDQRVGDVAPGIKDRFLEKVHLLVSRLPDGDQKEILPIVEHMKGINGVSFIGLMSEHFAYDEVRKMLNDLDNEALNVHAGKQFLDDMFNVIIAREHSFIKLALIKTFYNAARCATEEEAKQLSMYFLWFYKVANEKKA